jgi:hypothetical protein
MSLLVMSNISAQTLRRSVTDTQNNVYVIQFDSEDTSSGTIIAARGTDKSMKQADKNVSMTCVKDGMIGMPNISQDNYIGSFKHDNHTCYVFIDKD